MVRRAVAALMATGFVFKRVLKSGGGWVHKILLVFQIEPAEGASGLTFDKGAWCAKSRSAHAPRE